MVNKIHEKRLLNNHYSDLFHVMLRVKASEIPFPNLKDVAPELYENLGDALFRYIFHVYFAKRSSLSLSELDDLRSIVLCSFYELISKGPNQGQARVETILLQTDSEMMAHLHMHLFHTEMKYYYAQKKEKTICDVDHIDYRHVDLHDSFSDIEMSLFSKKALSSIDYNLWQLYTNSGCIISDMLRIIDDPDTTDGRSPDFVAYVTHLKTLKPSSARGNLSRRIKSIKISLAEAYYDDKSN